jgi:hypothetical protein
VARSWPGASRALDPPFSGEQSVEVSPRRSPRNAARPRLLAALRALVGAKVLVLVLGLSVALSWAMPALARAAVGPGPHVCHCEIRNGHSTCTCAKCFPDRDGLSYSEDSLRGQCGDDEAVLRESRFLDVGSPPSGFVMARPFRLVSFDPSESSEPVRPTRSPPTPPPRIVDLHG